MFITADQVLAHAVGDYILQSDWMANEKRKSHLAAAIHALTYTAPFLFLTLDIRALAFIGITHFIIDRWGIARYVVWAKNAPYPGSSKWQHCTATGYPQDRPAFLSVWLLIIADNILHVICNGVALKWIAEL